MKHERVLVRIEGTCVAADRLRAAMTRSSRYVLVDHVPHFIVEVQEDPEAIYVTFDGVHGEAEALIATEIQHLADGEYIVQQKAGSNFDDKRIRIIVPPTDVFRFAVEEGVVRGLDRYVQKLWKEKHRLRRLWTF